MASDDVLTMPLRWRRPRLIFVNSMSDLFHESVPDEWIDRIFAVMALSPQHTFQVLTKRSARMREYFAADPDTLRDRWYRAVPAGEWPVSVAEAYAAIHPHCSEETRALYRRPEPAWPLPNVWLGVSVEDQARADERIPDLLATPAAIRWISAEPLLGPVDILPYAFIVTHEDAAILEAPEVEGEPVPALPWRDPATTPPEYIDTPRLDWIVVGGESGPGARPMRADWARSLRDQCLSADVPFFFKQWGEWADERQLRFWVSDRFFTPDGKMTPGLWHEWPDSFCSVKVGKAMAGRTLDGVEHSAMPEPRP
jgi:protein gp37